MGICQACSPLLNQIALILSHMPTLSPHRYTHMHVHAHTHTDAFSFLKLVFTLSTHSPSFLTPSYPTSPHIIDSLVTSAPGHPNSAISSFCVKKLSFCGSHIPSEDVSKKKKKKKKMSAVNIGVHVSF